MTAESSTSQRSAGQAWYTSLPMAIVSAGVLFFDESGRVMLVRTTYKEDGEIPGGVVEAARGEKPVQAACREVAEELGITIAPPPVLAIDSVPTADDRPAMLAFVFDGGVLDSRQLGKIRFVDGEIAEMKFCDADQIRDLLVPRLARRVISSITARTSEGPWPAYLHHGT